MENNVWNILEKKDEYPKAYIGNLENLHDVIMKIIETVPKEDIRKLLDGMNYLGSETFAIMEYYYLNDTK